MVHQSWRYTEVRAGMDLMDAGDKFLARLPPQETTDTVSMLHIQELAQTGTPRDRKETETEKALALLFLSTTRI